MTIRLLTAVAFGMLAIFGGRLFWLTTFGQMRGTYGFNISLALAGFTTGMAGMAAYCLADL